MINRRHFLKSMAAAAVAPALPLSTRAADSRLGPLTADPGGMLDLAKGFSYRVVSRAGAPMADGFRVPFAHDGMAAFQSSGNRVILVCNHELGPSNGRNSAFVELGTAGFDAHRDRFYDVGSAITPGAGGTTTTIYNLGTGETERQHLSLAGTELNCAGGPTPWGSWLSCEECFKPEGEATENGQSVTRDKRHGYVFEVPADAKGLVDPVPLKELGRFEHEAAAVHRETGIVYMTEDQHMSLFYRFIPDNPGKLADGGRLQALVADSMPSQMTHNWDADVLIQRGVDYPVRWIDLDDTDPLEDTLRSRGAAAGAATFARGEGLACVDDLIVITCTIGGAARTGQVFAYVPSPFEGQDRELESPGILSLLAESTPQSLLMHADNITIAPWGDLIVCEDNSRQNSLVGIRPDGGQYLLADNPYSTSELAGACFAQDGKTLFVNIQYPGMTVAITGPFPNPQ